MSARIALLTLMPVILLAQDNTNPGAADLIKQITRMNAEIQMLRERVARLESKQNADNGGSAVPEPVQAASQSAQPAGVASETVQTAQPSGREQSARPALPESQQATPPVTSNFMRGVSLNFMLDGYYGYNFNDPLGRVNRLRAYDVLSNAFSLNQADVIVDNATDLSLNKRWGLRLDLQFGQATETLQGNAANEPRPDVYRNIFQAYGTYIAPLGKGLNIDFGKFASSLGIEGNFTQDQIDYSRSYWFNFLPFYHMGIRMSYPVTNQLTVNYWITNGTQQTEPFNGFKDQFAGIVYQPASKVSWTLNYYFGQEHPDVAYLPNSTDPSLPTEQGEPFLPVSYAPKGKLHIVDTYASWQTTKNLTLAMEADYVIQRLYTNSYPQVNWGGAGYARYQLTSSIAVAGRAEYMADGGLFSGTNQALKETTVTLEQKIIDGLLLREEWRRDFSNQPYFYTDQLNLLKREQNTATMGVVWWFGAKKSPW